MLLATHQIADFREPEGSKTGKNARIRATLRETRERRRRQVCKTYELKVDISHLSKSTRNQLQRLFLEAKWFYNDFLAGRDLVNAGYAKREVLVKNANGDLETRKLYLLSAQMRQEIVDRIRDNIRGLAVLKSKGYIVGRLRFKSRFDSLPLKQSGKTHQITSNYVRVQNIKQPLKVMGTNQIPEEAELSSAVLKQKSGNYYFLISTFQPEIKGRPLNGALGIDMGIEKQMTLSNGLDIMEGVKNTRRLKLIQRVVSRRVKYSSNWRKALRKLYQEYGRISNKKRDIKNKVVGKVVSTYGTIVVQDDSVAGWQKTWGRQVQESALGGITSALKQRAHTSIVIPRGHPTTMECSRCGATQKVALRERTYRCQRCGYTIDRNLNSAINILKEGVPAERRESTPVDIETATKMLEYFNGIPYVRASLVVETGSPRTSS